MFMLRLKTVTNGVTPFRIGAHLVVHEGDVIEKGSRITAGSINPHDILRIQGVEATQRYLVYEVQKVYKSQGVEINDKHIEVIVRQMLRKMKIEDAGDADVLPGDYVELNAYEEMNRRIQAAGGKQAEGKALLLGITKAALAYGILPIRRVLPGNNSRTYGRCY